MFPPDWRGEEMNDASSSVVKDELVRVEVAFFFNLFCAAGALNSFG
jgi:hypothetical protein